MDNMKLVMYDGTKATNLENVPEAWTWYGGRVDIDDKVRQRVAWLLRAENLRCAAVANMPFTIYRGETEITSSQDYEDPIGCIPNPTKFLRLVESALCNYGRAYFLKVANRAGYTKELKYFLPESVEPEFDGNGLKGFTRRVNTREYKYKPEEVLYFWPPDGTVEIGPPTVYPLMSAQDSGQLLYNVNQFSSKFMERGMVKATLLGVPRSTKDSERERVERWFDKYLTGIRNSFAVKTINSDDVKPTVIGDGLDGLTDTTLTRECKEDIAAGYGIPFAIFFSDAANYATAAQDWRQWYETGIIPECEFIGDVLNDQIYAPLGYRIEFHPETLDFFQDDENERSNSLTALVNAGVPLLTAMDILGFELTDEQRAAIEAEAMAKQERAAEMAQRLQQKPEQPEPPEPQRNDEAEEDVKRWERKALNAVKRGKPASVDFESVTIPPAWRSEIVAGLVDCQSAEDVRNLFSAYIETPPMVSGSTDITELLTEMKRANDLLEKSLDEQG